MLYGSHQWVWEIPIGKSHPKLGNIMVFWWVKFPWFDPFPLRLLCYFDNWTSKISKQNTFVFILTHNVKNTNALHITSGDGYVIGICMSIIWNVSCSTYQLKQLKKHRYAIMFAIQLHLVCNTFQNVQKLVIFGLFEVRLGNWEMGWEIQHFLVHWEIPVIECGKLGNGISQTHWFRPLKSCISSCRCIKIWQNM